MLKDSTAQSGSRLLSRQGKVILFVGVVSKLCISYVLLHTKVYFEVNVGK